MRIAITGSSGLIGSALRSSVEADGHDVVPLSRSPQPNTVQWDPMAGTIDAAGLEGVDAVVHLAGEGIASGPWTAKQRARIHDSRQQGTELLARTMAALDRPPAVLVSGSAVGYYGDRGSERLTESSAPGTDFLAQVCLDWEAATADAEAAGIRVVRLRTGIVLDVHGGALAKQLPIFKLGLGGRAGKGTQWMSWITLADEVRAIRFAIETDTVTGPLNLAAPGAVTNAEFAKAVGAALHRPAVMVIPSFVRRLPLGIGDLATSLLFSSQRVEPAALTQAGFRFDEPQLGPALASLLV